MGYTERMIRERAEHCKEADNRDGEKFFGELADVFTTHPDRVWGYQEFGANGVIVIGAELSEEERQAICTSLSHFEAFLFLAGFDKKSFSEDNSLVQRILMYGGTSDNWKWALGEGDWKRHYIELMSESDFNKQMGIQITEIKARRD